MAGDWIKVEKATPRKLEMLAISAKLGIHVDHAFGLCFRFWAWCDDNFSNSDAPSVTKALVSAFVERLDFVDALVSVGWFIDKGDSVEISNFDRHLSQTAKQRALTSLRNAKFRVKSRDAKETLAASPKEEKRREEKRVKGKPLTIPGSDDGEKNPQVDFSLEAIPETLRSTGFPDAWKEWLDHKRQVRSPVKLVGQNQAFNRALEIGGDVAAGKLRDAMANGYKGWNFESKGGGGGSSNANTGAQRYSG